MRNARFLCVCAIILNVTVSSFAFGASPAPNNAKGGSPTWVPEGPAPIDFGQTEGDTTNEEAAGAVNAVAPHPTNANILYIGGANGGIWKTTNAQSANPNWVKQTDDQVSLSIGDIAFDPTDGSGQTLVAGVARKSSLSGLGGARTGILRTTNGGNTWLAVSGMEGRSVIGVAPSGNTIVAAVDVADEFNCGEIGIFRTTNGGSTWAQITNGIAGGTVDALARDPVNINTLYASVVFASACNNPAGENGIYKSLDGGVSWFKSSPPATGFPLDGQLEDSGGTHVEMAVGNQNNFYVAIVPQSTGELGSVFYTLDGGAFWFQMDQPGSFEPSFFGIHPGKQGGNHLSLAVDPTNPNIVYVGGDRQPGTDDDEGGFPMANAVGARNFTGRLFRGDVTNFETGEWTPLTHDGTASGSAPHADSRDMAFDANGNLVEGDDGGVYRRTSPRGNGDWFTANGNLQIAETHSGAYDALSDVILGGNQDNGSTEQFPPGLRWITIRSGDGGDVAVVRNGNRSIRYASSQTLNGFVRLIYDANNNFVSAVSPALTVVSGSELDAQFTNPIATNPLNPNRLLVGATNALYESMDRGDTITEIATGLRVDGQNGRALVYGAGGNVDVIYAAGCIGACGDADDGSDGLFLRTSAAGQLNIIYPPSQAGFVSQVTVSPNNAGTAFFIENESSVIRSTGSGQSFNDVTGNLTSLGTGRLSSVLFMSAPGGNALAVGTDNGVFLSLPSSGFSSWTKLGLGLPNAPVFELSYDRGRDKLVATTLGRGSFSVTAFLNVSDVFFLSDFEL